MSTAQWTLVLTAAGGVSAWASFMAKLLWSFRGRWDETNATLAELRKDVAHLTDEDKKLQRQLESHLTWHTRRQIGG